MHIEHAAAAIRDLANIGYYRLAAYWYPFRIIERIDADGTIVRSPEFVPGTQFAEARAIWHFDRSLRLLLLEATEQIEVALRIHISHTLGATDPFGHLHPASLDTTRCAEPSDVPDQTRHDVWRTIQDDILGLYRQQWDDEPPVWVAVELLDFGMLSQFFRMMTKAQQSDVSRSFSITQGTFLTNWIKVLNHRDATRHDRETNVNQQRKPSPRQNSRTCRPRSIGILISD